MSGTRSPSRKVPVTEALIVAHGQPSAPAPAELALGLLAGQVQDHLPGWRIRSATMAAPGMLEAQAAMLPDGAPVYPFFMAGGHFVTRILPRRISGDRLRITGPLGLEPGLPALAARILARGGAPRQLLLAAHGSRKGAAAAEAARCFAGNLGPLLPETRIVTGFIEQTPTVAEAAAGLGPDAICLPFLALPGGHYREDVPQALAEAGFAGTLLPVLGLDPAIPALIARTLHRAAQEVDAA